MGKRLPGTPRSKIRAALRLVWMRSRERAAALKREEYCCEECGRKQSKAKGRELSLEVHHKNGIEWEKMIDYVYEKLLCDPKHLKVMCLDCHHKLHEKEAEE
jgi:predicted HNH restriction endonuclease